MDNPKQQNQSRFLIAALLSMTVFFGWSYFFAPKPKPNENSNTAQVTNTAATPAPLAQATPAPQTQPAATTPDNTPNKQITIKSDLYEVKLDSKGALATSWILFKDKTPSNERLIYADGSNETEKKPLQLISDEAKNRSPRELPFRLSTDDPALNTVLNERNYQVSESGDINLSAGQEKQIDFTLTDENGTQVRKTFIFRADSYLADLQISLTKGGQPVPNTKLVIGASIGDQGIKHHNFYHIEPEAIAFVNGDIFRHQGYSFTFPKDNVGKEIPDSSMPALGNIDWAGVGDAYFAMVAIPASQTQGLEYRAFKYDVQTEPFFDGIIGWVIRSPKTSETRHLITAYIPINADGSTTKIYTGTKDYFALKEYSASFTAGDGRSVNLVDTINFSNYRYIRPITKPLSIPILYSLNFLYNFTNNYGIAIIVFTLLFYSLLFPLRWSQSKSFKKASGNAPKMKDIQDRIKDLQKKGVPADDPRMRQLQMEQLKMTKDALPIGGCLPMLLQFPLLIAFYTAVTVSLAIRQATFLWLPDLSTGDPFHILEFAFAISMVLSMKFTPQTPTVTPEQQMQQKMMTYFMPVMMLWVMWAAPAGLLLYWFFGNIVSFVQQMLINKLNKKNEPPKEEIVDTMPKNTKKVKPKLSTS
jgi:YidC/Oxa1 family membrane protein insertase